MQSTLAFINLKGGTGKTVSAANVAHILAALHRKKVLLVDGDKQGNASRYFRRYGEQDGAAELLMLGPELMNIAAAIYPTEYKGLDIITSNMELYKTDRMLYDSERETARVLASALERVRNDYDFCIIDNGPAVDMVTLNVLAAADDVIIPIRPDEFSFSGLLDLVEQVQAVQEGVNPGLTMRGAFFTHCFDGFKTDSSEKGPGFGGDLHCGHRLPGFGHQTSQDRRSGPKSPVW
nr:ParA family protein [uncultured Oscillibacter sp.]